MRPPPPDLRPGLVWPVGIDPSGERGPTPGKARGPGWRRSGPGLYVPSIVDADSPEQRIVEAAARLPRAGAITGWAGLRWLGATWLDGRTPDGRGRRDVVLLATNADLWPFPGQAFSSERLNPADVVVVDGVPVTIPVRSVCFELRYPAGDREGIVVADMAAFANLVSRSEIATYLPYLSGWTGVQRVRDALPFISENSWSPPETRMRLVWLLDAHLPPVLCNQPVFDRRGNHLGTPTSWTRWRASRASTTAPTGTSGRGTAAATSDARTTCGERGSRRSPSSPARRPSARLWQHGCVVLALARRGRTRRPGLGLSSRRGVGDPSSLSPTVAEPADAGASSTAQPPPAR